MGERALDLGEGWGGFVCLRRTLLLLLLLEELEGMVVVLHGDPENPRDKEPQDL